MRKQKNALEWTVFVVSLILTLGVLGYLAYEVVGFTGASPAIYVRLAPVSAQGERFVVPVQVYNEGGEPAEEVRVTVVLHVEGREVEQAEITFARLARNTTRKGWAVFTTDPAAGTLRAHVSSYQTP